MSKVCVITGASAGLGAELARQLGRTGRYHLVLAARRSEELAKVASECGCPTKTVVADVTNRNEMENILTAAISEFGRCDIWVNNVGRGISKSVLEITDEDIDAVISINLKSAVYGSQISAAHFRKAGSGHILNISSFLGKAPVAPIRSIYSASKAALNSLTSNLRMELLSSGVHVTTVLPSTSQPRRSGFLDPIIHSPPADSSRRDPHRLRRKRHRRRPARPQRPRPDRGGGSCSHRRRHRGTDAPGRGVHARRAPARHGLEVLCPGPPFFKYPFASISPPLDPAPLLPHPLPFLPLPACSPLFRPRPARNCRNLQPVALIPSRASVRIRLPCRCGSCCDIDIAGKSG